MRVDNNITAIAIGSFDGIHKAHQSLISKADAIVVIERNCGSITAGYRRGDFVDIPIYFYHFRTISNLNPSQFIDKLIEDFPNLKDIIVGYDFEFGYKKSGNISHLRDIFKGKVTVIEEIFYNNISLHSRVIRKSIKDGNIELANGMLGRYYECKGKIIKGQGIGSKELVSTINIETNNYTLPKDGVYATEILINNIWYKSISFIGNRTSTDNNFAIETHIIDTDIILNSYYATIKWLKFIRDNKKFDNLIELKVQIEEDIRVVKTISHSFTLLL